MLAEERADVAFDDVALVVLILEETEAAGDDGRNLRTVAGAGDGGACAANLPRLIVTASLGIDVPIRAEDARVAAGVVVATGLNRPNVGAGGDRRW